MVAQEIGQISPTNTRDIDPPPLSEGVWGGWGADSTSYKRLGSSLLGARDHRDCDRTGNGQIALPWAYTLALAPLNGACPKRTEE